MNKHKTPTNERILSSRETDLGLYQIRFVLHGNSSVKDSRLIEHTGLNVNEGRATVSTDLAHANDWATSDEKREYSTSTTERTNHESGTVKNGSLSTLEPKAEY